LEDVDLIATVDELNVDAWVPDAVPKSINFRRVDDTNTVKMLILSEVGFLPKISTQV
jgi:hypothetical protein